MTKPVSSWGTPPIPFGAIGYQADERTGKRLGRAVLLYHFSRPMRWISMLVVTVFFLSVGVGLNFPLQMALILVVSLVTAGSTQYLGYVRALRRLYPAGSLHWTLFGPTGVVIAGPIAVGEMSYAAFRDVWSSESVVVLRSAQTKVFYALPTELVPPMELDRLRALTSRSR